jgi:membrane protein
MFRLLQELIPVRFLIANLRRIRIQVKQVRRAVKATLKDVDRHHTLQMSAALAYYYFLAVFPALIFLSAVVTYIPIPNLFDQAMYLIAQIVPADSMDLVRKVLSDVISPNRGAFLSFGLIFTLWAMSSGFAAAIEALNISYDVEEARPFWKTWPLAVGLAFLTGFLLLVALAVMIAGPQFGIWLCARLHLSRVFAAVWPFIHWTVGIGFNVLAVEFLYYLAPNVKQRFKSTLPGAVLSVACWLLLSYALGVYFREFAGLNKTYGTLGAVAGLMIWLNWNQFVMLVGAELNAELAKQSKLGAIQQQEILPPMAHGIAA